MSCSCHPGEEQAEAVAAAGVVTEGAPAPAFVSGGVAEQLAARRAERERCRIWWLVIAVAVGALLVVGD